MVALQSAEEPGAAVRQFLEARKDKPEDPALMAAFVAKMVEFGLPESAGPTAQRLVQVDPQADLAWAVVAHMALQRGDLATAASAVRQAMRTQSSHPFVIVSAAHAVALYDSQTTLAAFPADLAGQIEQVRAQLASDALFVETHARALSLLRRPVDEQAQADAQARYEAAQPSDQPEEPVIIAEYDQPDVIIVDSPTVYPYSYSYYPYYSYPYYYPYPYYYRVPRLYSYYGSFYYPFPFHEPFIGFFHSRRRHDHDKHWRWHRSGHGWTVFRDDHGLATDPFRTSEFLFRSLAKRDALTDRRFHHDHVGRRFDRQDDRDFDKSRPDGKRFGLRFRDTKSDFRGTEFHFRKLENRFDGERNRVAQRPETARRIDRDTARRIGPDDRRGRKDRMLTPAQRQATERRQTAQPTVRSQTGRAQKTVRRFDDTTRRPASRAPMVRRFDNTTRRPASRAPMVRQGRSARTDVARQQQRQTQAVPVRPAAPTQRGRTFARPRATTPTMGPRVITPTPGSAARIITVQPGRTSSGRTMTPQVRPATPSAAQPRQLAVAPAPSNRRMARNRPATVAPRGRRFGPRRSAAVRSAPPSSAGRAAPAGRSGRSGSRSRGGGARRAAGARAGRSGGGRAPAGRSR